MVLTLSTACAEEEAISTDTIIIGREGGREGWRDGGMDGEEGGREVGDNFYRRRNMDGTDQILHSSSSDCTRVSSPGAIFLSPYSQLAPSIGMGMLVQFSSLWQYISPFTHTLRYEKMYGMHIIR